MSRSRFRALVAIAVLLLILPMVATVGSRQAVAQDATPIALEITRPAPLAEAMPVETAAYVSAEIDPGSDQFTQLGALLAQLIIPGAGDTISAIVEQIVNLLAKIPSDLRTVLTGEIGAAIAGLNSDDSILSGELPGIAIVLHPQRSGNARDLVENWFTDQVTQSGGSVERSEDGSTVILRSRGIDADAGDLPSTLVFAGDYILLGQDLDALAPYIEAVQGDTPSLASTDDLDTLNKALPAERLLYGYLDPTLLLDAVAGLSVAGVSLDALDEPFGTTAFTVAAASQGLRVESVSIPLSQGRGLIDRSDANPGFAAQVPDSTLALFAGRDLGETWAMDQLQKVLLETLVGAMGGGDMDLSDFSVDDQFGFLSMLSGINFKTDLFDHLSGDYGVALFSVDAGDPLASSAVISSELSDPNVVSVAVTSLGPLIQSAGAGAASVTTASVDDQTVNNVTLSTDSIDGTIQYGVVDDQLMIGLGNGIETVAVEPVASLESSAGYQAAMAELPADYDNVLYLDTRALAEQLVPLLVASMSDGSSNALVRCLAGENEVTEATPVAEVDGDFSISGWALDAGCSVLNGLLGGDGALLDLVLNRVPGPFTAVSYEQDDLQHTSGILLVSSTNS